MASVVTPYSGAMRLINAKDVPSWMNEYDAQRVASYSLYEDIYWTQPNSFKLVQRGNEENPLYIPSGRIIVNTMDRYAGVDWTPVMDPTFGTPEQQVAALQAMRGLFRRERMAAQYDSAKLYGLIRGDWCFTIEANPNKPQGTRLKIKAIDPAMVFPIEDPYDTDRNLGIDLVEQFTMGETLVIKRVRYLKSEHPDHPSGGGAAGGAISYQVDVLEVEDWETNPKIVRNPDVEKPVTLLNPAITAPPVYLIRNFEEPQNPWGSSEMRGLERIFAGVNQTITDQELALALEGLGMYKSDKGQPRDASGNPTSWVLGPGRVVHDETFARIDGVKSVVPFLDHAKYLQDQAYQTIGTSEVARGNVDVSVAESGIALALRLGPIINASKKKNRLIESTMDQFMFDLQSWLKVYDGIDTAGTMFASTFGQAIPRDLKAEFDRLLQMYTADPPLITAEYFRDAARELGMGIPTTLTQGDIALERQQYADLSDPMSGREQQELDNPTDDSLDAEPDAEE